MSSDKKDVNAINPGAFVAIGCMFLVIGISQDGPLRFVMTLVGIVFMVLSFVGSLRVLSAQKEQAAQEEPPADIMPR